MMKSRPILRADKDTHGFFGLLTYSDMLDSVVLYGKLTFGGKPDRLLVGAAAPALFLGLSFEIQPQRRAHARVCSP